MNALLMDNLQGIRAIKAFAREGHEDVRFAEKAGDVPGVDPDGMDDVGRERIDADQVFPQRVDLPAAHLVDDECDGDVTIPLGMIVSEKELAP